MTPLVFLNPGEIGVVAKVGGSPDHRQHLKSLGFVVGASVSLVSKRGEDLIVSVKGSRIALGRDLARKILV